MFEQFRFKAKRGREVDAGNSVDGTSKRSCTIAGSRATRGTDTVAPSEHVHEQNPVTTAAVSVAPKWQERWHGICTPCFDSVIECLHHPEQRLRLLIVGHNPSSHAWQNVVRSSNPSNHMWRLLTGTLPPLPPWQGVLPADAQVVEQNCMPFAHGIGMTSIGLEPGNDAAKYGKDTMVQWRRCFYRRLQRHMQRVCRLTHGADATASTGAICCSDPSGHAPMIIAFSGKRQFSWMFSPPLTKVEHFGRQSRFPPDWPREARVGVELWVLPSTSGRAAMTREERALPYQQLAMRMHQLPWPMVGMDDSKAGIKDEHVDVVTKEDDEAGFQE
ncbi:TPA: hypothetical protein N0F65_002514 [Lagenidium giganteum]|uniref:Uncharacterized protein n=1 Tax=Lagenidium giganteum TaxID=4803 RepID=A0AAV2YZA2_9STRA|nr:TPA: hypothetical protein N0F65_002514 [Lagenidium giganteum]